MSRQERLDAARAHLAEARGLLTGLSYMQQSSHNREMATALIILMQAVELLMPDPDVTVPPPDGYYCCGNYKECLFGNACMEWEMECDARGDPRPQIVSVTHGGD